jgi:uncharacterized OsmC-like protein
MDAEQLRRLQSPLKQQYRDDPSSARVVMSAHGSLVSDQLACDVTTPQGVVRAGLHPAAGGDGSQACSGDMLLQALVACSGVTLSAVATAMSIPISAAKITAEAEMDFRGTLGIDKATPIGILWVHLRFEIESSAEDAQLAKLVQLAERYCVVLQSLTHAPKVTSEWKRPV